MNDQNYSVSRRKFIQTAATAALAAPLLLESCAPKTKLRHASIGVGGMMGFNDLQNFVSHPNVEIVAICDVDENFLKKALEIVPNARTYSDWRELLKNETGNIDSVNVTVPDHNHFTISYHAIQLGKHVYCQKPMCHDVAEVRLLAEASVKKGVITQLGTQHASSANDRRAVQLIKEGAIGKVKHAYLCSNRPGAEKYRLAGPRPVEGTEPPGNLNWDVWIGPAPQRAFVPDIYHTVMWRSWLDFGTGWSGDIGCHIFDAVWKGLGLTPPKNVIAEVQKSWQESPERRADNWPQSNHITWKFPGNELTESEELPLEWFDGEFFPPEEIRKLFPGDPYPPESAMLVGTEGALLVVHGNDLALLPHDKFKNHKIPNFKDRNHYHHFVDACLGGEKTESHFAQTGPMTEAIILGTVAIRVPDVLLDWDSANLMVTNNADANKLLRRTYREGWQVAGF
jgi:predicted dehydrogenase